MSVAPCCAICGARGDLVAADAWLCCAPCAALSPAGRVAMLDDRSWCARSNNDRHEIAAVQRAFAAMGQWARARREARR